MKLKKIAAALAAGTALLSLTGCGAGAGGNSEGGSPVGAVSEDGTREVVFWHSMKRRSM